MDRKKTATYRMSERGNDDFVPGTPAYRVGLVWRLTCEVLALDKTHDAEQPLQRHVVRLFRRGETKDVADAEAMELLKGPGSDTTHPKG